MHAVELRLQLDSSQLPFAACGLTSGEQVQLQV
jgi:hypothetical protein